MSSLDALARNTPAHVTAIAWDSLSAGEGRRLLHLAAERMKLTARGYDRVLKVARTVADLSASDRVEADHVAEALQFRLLE